MHGFHRDVLVQSLLSKFATFQKSCLSIKTEHREDKLHTDSALFLSPKWNVIVQNGELVHPDLRKESENQADHRVANEHLDEITHSTGL